LSSEKLIYCQNDENIRGAPVGEPTMGKFQNSNDKEQINFKIQ